jgi:tetratricopeptide (TPR) repeat protein
MEVTSVVPGTDVRVKLLFAVILLLFALPAPAQKTAASQPPTPRPMAPTPPPSPTTFDQNKLIIESNSKIDTPQLAKEENCFLPPLNGVRGPTVELSGLQIPLKAKREYEDGCAALRNKKAADAENHLRKAVKQYPRYSAAWVLLGQTLGAQQKTDEAREACSQPVTSDSNYRPAYLCIADIAARSQRWDEVLKYSNRALELDPSSDAVGYAYNAAANLNLHNLPQAEKSALRAADLDKNNADPRIHFLLAQIYEAKGDRVGEAAQLREYLKYASDPADVTMVKSYLAELDKLAGK